MPLLVPKKLISLRFHSAADINLFKQECTSQDFYTDSDSLTVVGFFPDDEIYLARTKYEVRIGETEGETRKQ